MKTARGRVESISPVSGALAAPMDFYRPLGAAPHLELVNPTRARLLELLETAPELLELTPAADPVGVARCRAAAAKFLRAVSRR